jgi:hypothetical protein
MIAAIAACEYTSRRSSGARAPAGDRPLVSARRLGMSKYRNRAFCVLPVLPAVRGIYPFYRRRAAGDFRARTSRRSSLGIFRSKTLAVAMAIVTSREENDTRNGAINQSTAMMTSLSVEDDGLHSSRVPGYLNDALALVESVETLGEACHSRTMQSIDDIIHALERGTRVSGESAKGALDAVSKSTKSLHGAVSKLSKHIDVQSGKLAEEVRVLNSKVLSVSEDDSSQDSWSTMCERNRLMCSLVVEHLYTSGNFDAGDMLAMEAGIADWEEIKNPYIELLSIESELENHRLEQALAWVDLHAETLKTNVRYVENRLPFMLHRLAFLQILDAQGTSSAIQYAETHMQPFYRTHCGQIHQLLGGMAFGDMFMQQRCSPIVSQRYGFMYNASLRDSLWAEARTEFRRQFCFVIRKPQDSPLLVSASAGSLVLPTLLKYSKVAAKSSSLSSDGQLPIELPLPDEFAFHSTFTCPVSKETNTASDPAVALPCGHCLNKSSVLKIAKSPSRRFKCPYCPQETLFVDCLELNFV